MKTDSARRQFFLGLFSGRSSQDDMEKIWSEASLVGREKLLRLMAETGIGERASSGLDHSSLGKELIAAIDICTDKDVLRLALSRR